MPARGRNARDAKWRREEGRAQGRTGFAKHNLMPSSPNASDYCPSSSDDAVESDSDSDSSDDQGAVNRAAMSVVAMQRIYSVFLPPHLRPKDLEAKPREKRSKAANKRAVYSLHSRTTIYRRKVKLRKAAKGSEPLETYGFVLQKKVGSLSQMIPKAKYLIANRRDSAAPHRLEEIQMWR